MELRIDGALHLPLSSGRAREIQAHFSSLMNAAMMLVLIDANDFETRGAFCFLIGVFPQFGAASKTNTCEVVAVVT